MSVPLAGYTTPAAAAITGLTVTRSSGTNVKLLWNVSTDAFHKRYKVYRSTDNFTTETLIKTSKLTEHRDTELGTGTFYYRIVDIDTFDGESPASDIVSIVIGDLVPFKDTFDIPNAGTPVVKDINAALGRNATEGTIICLGTGKIQVEFSYDGTTYDTPMWLRQEDYYNISSKKNYMSLAKIRFDTDVNGTDVSISVI